MWPRKAVIIVCLLNVSPFPVNFNSLKVLCCHEDSTWQRINKFVNDIRYFLRVHRSVSPRPSSGGFLSLKLLSKKQSQRINLVSSYHAKQSFSRQINAGQQLPTKIKQHLTRAGFAINRIFVIFAFVVLSEKKTLHGKRFCDGRAERFMQFIVRILSFLSNQAKMLFMFHFDIAW